MTEIGKGIIVNKYGAIDVSEYVTLLNRINWLDERMDKLKDILLQELKIDIDDYDYVTATKLVKKGKDNGN